MDSPADTVTLEAIRTGGTQFKVTARFNGGPVHTDTINPATASHRDRFGRAVVARLPTANAEDIDAELLRLADTTAAQPDPPPGVGKELDISRIVRPEQFITPQVCGCAVPVVIDVAGKPTPQWRLYLRWTDGRRECVEIADNLELTDGMRLWIHPRPSEPAMNTACGWSAPSRQAWLAGSASADPAEVFHGICERIAYFIDFPENVGPGITATLALWVILTYVYQAWDAVAYLHVAGPKESDKMTVFNILARLAFRPLQSTNLTAPGMFRTLHARGSVLLLDEAERLRQSTPDVGELMSLLLAGYKRGTPAVRLEPVDDTFEPVEFDVYGPKALACIAGLPDTLASRCICMMMFRAAPGSPKPRRRIDADPKAWAALRDDLHVLALENGPAWLELAQRADVCPQGMSGRAYELWQPLLALASWIESRGATGLLGLMQRHAQGSIESSKDDQVPEHDEVLLELLTEEVRAGRWVTPSEIRDRAKERDPGEFDLWQASGVARRLKIYGFRTRKVGSRREYRNVTLADLRRVQQHYGIELGIPDPLPTPGTPSHPSQPSQSGLAVSRDPT